MFTQPSPFAPRRILLRLAFTATLGLGWPRLPADQPSGTRGASHDLFYGYSAASEVESDHGNAGRIKVGSFSILSAQTYRPSDACRLKTGVSYGHFAIDATAGVPVPDTLRSLALDLNLRWQASPEWSFLLGARPGLYGDDASLGWKNLNSPAFIAASREFGPALTLTGGVHFDAFAEHPVLPLLGLRWRATPRLAVTLGAPRTEITGDLGGHRRVFAGASLLGGAFHTDDPSLIAPINQASLRDAKVTYREIRLGAGVRWPLSARFALQLEAGWVADRRFDYRDRGLVVKTDGAGYGQLSLFSRF